MVQFQLFTWWHLYKWNFDMWHLEFFFMKIIFKMLISTTIMIILSRCIYIVTHGIVKSFHMAYDWILENK